MRYTKGEIRRVFLLKFEDGDILIDELSALAKKEKIKSAVFVFLGALKKGDIVTGPKKPVIPPEPNWKKFGNAWEAMGIGTIFTGSGSPQVHVHTSMGQKNRVLTGCVRKSSSVFLVIEAVVFELGGVRASKSPDPKTGLNLLKIL
jgi:predicted DNA-binding protein with PD1-like motif